jgi:hypothetical protein
LSPKLRIGFGIESETRDSVFLVIFSERAIQGNVSPLENRLFWIRLDIIELGPPGKIVITVPSQIVAAIVL